MPKKEKEQKVDKKKGGNNQETKVEELEQQGAGKVTKKEVKTDVTKKLKKEGLDTKVVVHGRRERKQTERLEIQAPVRQAQSTFQRLLSKEQHSMVQELSQEGMMEGENALQKAIRKHIAMTENRKRQTEKKRQIRIAIHSKVDSDPIVVLTKKINEYRKTIDKTKDTVGKVIESYPIFHVYEHALEQLRRMYGDKFVTYPGSYVELTKLVKQQLGSAPTAYFMSLEKWNNSELSRKIGEDFDIYTETKPKLLNAYVDLKKKLMDVMDALQVDKSTTEGFRNTKEAEKISLATQKLTLEGMVETEARVLIQSGQHITEEQVKQEKANRVARDMPHYYEMVQEIENEIAVYEDALTVYRDKLEQLNGFKEKYLSEERLEANPDGSVDKYYLTILDIRSYIQNELEFLFERDIELQSGQGRYNFELGLAMTETITSLVEQIKQCKEVYIAGIKTAQQKGWMSSTGGMDVDVEDFSAQQTDDLLAMFGKLGFMTLGGKGKKEKKKRRTSK